MSSGSLLASGWRPSSGRPGVVLAERVGGKGMERTLSALRTVLVGLLSPKTAAQRVRRAVSSSTIDAAAASGSAARRHRPAYDRACRHQPGQPRLASRLGLVVGAGPSKPDARDDGQQPGAIRLGDPEVGGGAHEAAAPRVERRYPDTLIRSRRRLGLAGEDGHGEDHRRGRPTLAAPSARPSTPALSVRGPAKAWTVRYEAPSAPRTLAALRVVVGMSASFRSTKTLKPGLQQLGARPAARPR